MATSEMRVFALPEELVRLLTEQADRLGLVATVYPPHFTSPTVGERISLRELPREWVTAPADIMRIFLHAPADARSVSRRNVMPGEFDWIDVWPGRLLNDLAPPALELTSIGVKSDHVACLRLFSQLARPLKARLFHPMRIRSVLNGAERVYVEYYTSGVQQFHDAGGDLVQWGVRNLRFYPAGRAANANSL